MIHPILIHFPIISYIHLIHFTFHTSLKFQLTSFISTSSYIIHFFISSFHLIHFPYNLSHILYLVLFMFLFLISSRSLIHCRISLVLSFCSSVCVWFSHFYWRNMIQVCLECMEVYGIQLWYGLRFFTEWFGAVLLVWIPFRHILVRLFCLSDGLNSLSNPEC